ncbi:MAG: hypothetical protein GXP49_09085 [Deltaproteobacteria bacterium]|nr:hypothetical protein [Deltaproteobacteria bacterium]
MPGIEGRFRKKATFNHIRWPDGKASLDSVEVEPDMLEFLKRHPQSI